MSTMSPTLNPPQLCLGIDVGKSRHVVAFLSGALLARHHRFELCPVTTVEPNRASIDVLLAHIGQLAPPSACAALLEYTGHYHRALEEALLAAGLTVYLIGIKSRAASQEKSDRHDAQRLANLLYSQVVLGAAEADPALRLVLRHPPSDTAARLRPLIQRHVELVSDTTRRKNRLTGICDELFPEFTTLFKNPNAPIALSLRASFPAPAEIAAASPAQLAVVATHRRLPGPAKLAALQELARASIGISAPARKAALVIEQGQLIAELRLLEQHRDLVDREIATLIEGSREGQILLSFGCIGPFQAASILSAIGAIGNFESRGKLKKFFGWSPVLTQTGTTTNRAALTPAGNALMKHTLYLVAMRAVRFESEWQRLYQRLLPRKCTYDARLGRYLGRRRVLGRIAGQITELIYTLLTRDAQLLASTPPGSEPAAPTLYDPALHHTGGERGAPQQQQQSPPRTASAATDDEAAEAGAT